MKKVLSLLLVVVFVLAFSSVAFASNTQAEEGFDASPVFERGDFDSYEHQLIDGRLAFDTDTGRRALPNGNAGANASEDSVVYAHPDYDDVTLVDPLRTWD